MFQAYQTQDSPGEAQMGVLEAFKVPEREEVTVNLFLDRQVVEVQEEEGLLSLAVVEAEAVVELVVL
jgi:hypothetical protein